MRSFNKVAIIGVGLIGGSLGLAIKNKGLAKEVVGVSRRRTTLALAKKKGAIDYGSQKLSVIKDADLVIFATPVSVILKLAPLIKKNIKPSCIVTDVASTKRKVTESLSRVFKNYVGTHPLAGSQKHGVLYARADIFKDSLCLIVPAKNTDLKIQRKIEDLWTSLGAKLLRVCAKTHDEALSYVSHLPHLAAFCLINVIPDGFLKFSSSGLKDTTRIAASEAGLWADIFLSNRKNMLKAISLFRKDLSWMSSLIDKNNKGILVKVLTKAKAKREGLD